MATTCTKCGEALIGQRKFCASCGAPAPTTPSTLESKAYAPPAARPAPTTDPPRTQASSPGAAMPPPQRSSGYGPPPPPANPAPPPAPATYPAPQGYANPPPGYAPYAPPAPAPYAPPAAYAPALVAGSRVLVQWADGNRYPGFVQQVAPGYCLIVFPDGQQRWVEPQYLTLAP